MQVLPTCFLIILRNIMVVKVPNYMQLLIGVLVMCHILFFCVKMLFNII